MKKLLKLLLLGCLAMACQSPAEAPQSQRPNVILIMTDDQGYGDLSCHGNPYLKTPNIDELYSQSVRLTDFHVGTTCSPTRGALMSGQNCNRVGVWHTIAGRSQLPGETITMAEIFTANDYQTAMFGKWHLGDSYPFRPQDQGFQTAFYHGGGGVGQMPDYWDNDYFDDTYFRAGTPESRQGYCTDVWFDAALSFIETHKEKPFFTYLATNAPHGPFHVDSAYMEPYLDNPDIPNPNFYGMIANLDENMGVLLSKLDEWGLAENTLIVFMTDNGTSGGVKLDKDGQRLKGFNAGMRGLKGSQYEGGHRVPCFLRWPAGNIKGGKDVKQLTAHVDLIPTFMDLLGLEMNEKLKLDGTVISPLLRGEEGDDRFAERVIITDTQRDEWPEKWKKSATMQGKWRLINQDELYDISLDPAQRNNIAAAHPEKVEALQKAYEAWWAELEPGFAKFSRALIGEDESSIMLYGHDWHDIVDNFGNKGNAAWHQNHIRNGHLVNGDWAVEIAQAGTYEFELWRWPEETDLAIGASLPEKAVVPGGKIIPAGQALAIKTAGIQIADQEMTKAVPADAKSISFQIELEAGPTLLKTFFEGEGDLRLGAYYVRATQIN